MSPTTPPTTSDLTALARERARAEAREVAAIVRFRDAELQRIAQHDSPMLRLVERSGIPGEIGRATGRSEGQVHQLLATADRLLEHAPLTWAAFAEGRIDLARAREISLTLDRLHHDSSRERLDAQGVTYAETHTVAETRAWLRRFVARVEADLAVERSEAEVRRRHVQVTHVDDGMAWVAAYLPSHQAAAIATRLRREARARRRAGDDRTIDQLRADLLAAWALTRSADDAARPTGTTIDVAVTIDAPVLVGAADGHAESADGAWTVPAAWVLEAAADGQGYFHRLLLDPVTGDTLRHDYRGYAPPDLLRRAIVLRDGTCVAPGCTRPAAECELDHREPWPAGRTSGENLDPRCTRHHALKGHRLLRRDARSTVERRLPPP
ncbi:MAG: DUF222 domain-containing protein [Aeromicrobium erythreum]